jgi:hypothetical protein
MPRCFLGRPLTRIALTMLRIVIQSDLSPRAAARGER